MMATPTPFVKERVLRHDAVMLLVESTDTNCMSDSFSLLLFVCMYACVYTCVHMCVLPRAVKLPRLRGQTSCLPARCEQRMQVTL